MAHFRAGRAGISEKAYPEMEEFFADLAKAYREEIADLAQRGCRYIQLDEVAVAMLCDRGIRETIEKVGLNPEALVDESAVGRLP